MRELPQHVQDAIARAEAKPELRVVTKLESPQRVLRFTVPRPPVGKNRRYVNATRHPVLSSEARDYLSTTRAYALLEARKVGWPKPNTVGSVFLEITTLNTKHDADAAIALTQDALEGIVYANDRVVQGVSAKKCKDDGAARVEIAVTLVSMVEKQDKRRKPRGGIAR